MPIDALAGAIAALASSSTPCYDLPGFGEANDALANKQSWYIDGPPARWRDQ